MPVGRILFRAFHTRGVYANMPAFRRVISEGMKQVVVPTTIQLLREEIAYWPMGNDEEFIKFMGLPPVIDESGISVRVLPTGPGLRIWKFRSFGTKEHTVRVKKLHTMRHWVYQKYKPALAIPFKGIRRGLGPVPFAPGTAKFRYEITIPEVAGRHYEYNVAVRYKAGRWFSNDMEKIVRRAIRAAQKEGT